MKYIRWHKKRSEAVKYRNKHFNSKIVGVHKKFTKNGIRYFIGNDMESIIVAPMCKFYANK